MAERRMFAKSIIDTDAFLCMPLSTQALYFHLCMRADDDGFVSNPRKIQRMISCSDDDLKLLIAKRYILVFDSGVIVIKHWKIHNYIRKDAYKKTMYLEEKSSLYEKSDGAYTDHPVTLSQRICDESVTEPSQNCDEPVDTGKVRIGKVRLGKVSIDKDDSAEPGPISAPPVISFPLNDGTEYPIYQEQCQEWAGLYPAVDVIQQIRAMRGWLDANPTRRKTKSGVMRFINGWLAKEQNKGGGRTCPNTTQGGGNVFMEMLREEESHGTQ